MGSSGAEPASPSGRSIALASVGWLGLSACLVMVFLAMRAVMDVGGYCAEGGPYVIRQACPEGSTPALFLGIFGGLFFGFVASVGGFAVGGIWAATPLLAWSALFGSLGWNFMEYGVFSAPDGIEWGWAVCGVVFWVMAVVPLLGLLPALRGEWLGPATGRGTGGGRRPGSGGGVPGVVVLDGPGQPASGPIAVTMTGMSTVSPDGHTISSTSTVIDGDMPDAMRAQLGAMADRINAATASGTPDEHREELEQIAADFGAVIGTAMADLPADPVLRGQSGPAWLADDGPPAGGEAPAGGAAPAGAEPVEAAFTEGTQALLDRLERLADMRDRALLAPDEYETAKAAIMAELEGRS